MRRRQAGRSMWRACAGAASTSRFLQAKGACAEARETSFVTGAGAVRCSGTAAPLGGGKKKKKNHLRVTSGKDAFVHGETHTARAAPETGARRGRYSPSPPPAAPPPAAPLGASFHGSPARAAATAVIPSILNLTSSHTRDEVIEGNARHVRSAPIGRRGSGGRGAGAAGRVAVGDGYGGSPTRRPSPTGSAAGGSPHASASARGAFPRPAPRGGDGAKRRSRSPPRPRPANGWARARRETEAAAGGAEAPGRGEGARTRRGRSPSAPAAVVGPVSPVGFGGVPLWLTRTPSLAWAPRTADGGLGSGGERGDDPLRAALICGSPNITVCFVVGFFFLNYFILTHVFLKCRGEGAARFAKELGV